MWGLSHQKYFMLVIWNYEWGKSKLTSFCSTQDGWLDDPPNVDFLDIEFENDDKKRLRRNMINGLTDTQLINTKHVTKDEVNLLNSVK